MNSTFWVFQLWMCSHEKPAVDPPPQCANAYSVGTLYINASSVFPRLRAAGACCELQIRNYISPPWSTTVGKWEQLLAWFCKTMHKRILGATGDPWSLYLQASEMAPPRSTTFRSSSDCWRPGEMATSRCSTRAMQVIQLIHA